jgi:predicted O-methyltransferase YrrM
LAVLRLAPSARGWLGGSLAATRAVAELWCLPPTARPFYRSALLTAAQLRDGRALRLSLPPRALRTLLELTTGRRTVVELGTACAWTAIALALADAKRHVWSLDPTVWDTREAYLGLVPPPVRGRVSLLLASGTDERVEVTEVDAVFVDTNHRYETVMGCFDTWAPRLRAGGVMIFDDFDHPSFPGVSRAISDLRLAGTQHGRFFVWERQTEARLFSVNE